MSNLIDATVAKRYDITVKNNQTFDMVISFFDEIGNPINVIGASFKMSVRQDGCNNDCACIGDSPFEYLFKQDFIAEVVGSNQIQINSIINLGPGTYKYDLLAEFVSGARKYLLTGNFKVKRSYTQITT